MYIFFCNCHVALYIVLQFYHNTDLVNISYVHVHVHVEPLYVYVCMKTSDIIQLFNCVGNISNQDLYLNVCSKKETNLGHCTQMIKR